MTEDLRPVLIGAAVGAGVSFVVLVAAVLRGRRGGATSRAAVALAIGLGVVVGQYVATWPTLALLLPKKPVPWPEWSATFWAVFGDAIRLPLLLPLVALVLGVLEAGWPTPAWARGENRLLTTLFAVWLLYSWTTEEDHWSAWGTRPLVGKGATFAILLAAWTNLEWLAAKVEGSRLLLPLVAVAGTAAPLFFIVAQLPLMFLAVPVAAVLATAWLVSWFVPGISLARGGVPIVVLALGSLLGIGFLTSEPGRFPLASVLLMAGAPLVLWILRLGPARRLRAWQATILGTLAIAIPLGVAVVLALRAAPDEPAPSPDTTGEVSSGSPL